MKARKLIINGVRDISIMEEELDLDQMSPEECLIETSVSMISAGTELSRVFGLKKGAAYPVRPGYCSVGKVLKTGEQVSRVQEGDTVLFSGPHGSLHFYDPKHSDGGVLYKLNEKTKPSEGAFLMMCWIAMNGILPADVKLGDTVAIMGMGTLGLVLTIYYRQMGAKVIAIEPVGHRAELAGKLGADHVVNCSPEGQYDAVMEITSRRGADIVVDASGLSVCVETGLKIAAVNGQVLLLGSPRTEYITNVTDSFSAIHSKMLTVIGAFNRRYPYQAKEGSRLSIERSLKYIEKLLNEKKIDIDMFISHIISPIEEEIMTAYEGLMYKKDEYAGIVLIDWQKGGGTL